MNDVSVCLAANLRSHFCSQINRLRRLQVDVRRETVNHIILLLMHIVDVVRYFEQGAMLI